MSTTRKPTVSGQADLELERFGMVIGGERRLGESTYQTVNPATGEPWALVADAAPTDVDDAVNAAHAAYANTWRGLSPTRRGRFLLDLADRLAEGADELARIETRENGKLLREMRAQANAVPDYLRYWAGLADKVEGRVVPLDGKQALNYTLREPLGVVGVITPWNSPLLIAIQGLAPALAAGNTVVVKPSEVASTGVVRMVDFAERAGLPPGVLNVITGGPAAGSALAEHRGVSKLVFTGGVATGRSVARSAADRIAGCLLELGGKSPNIVFEDADLAAAQAGLLAGIYGAAGQTCIAGSRALVHEAIYEEFVELLRERTDAIVIGDPVDPRTEMGPLATPAQLEKVERYVDDARQSSARIVSGGTRVEVPELPNGFFYRPTIVDRVDTAAPVVQEEIFGPVLAVMPFSSEAEAIMLANGTDYGLAAGIWTQDIKRAHRVAAAIEAGIVWINTYRAASFNSPFGGHGQSGLGRENSRETIYEFLQTKSVWCELSDEVRDPFMIRL